MYILYEDLLRESQLLSEGRVEDARERYPNIPQPVFDIFVSEDPSGNNKYLMGICKIWEDEYKGRSWRYNGSGWARNLMESVSYFHSQTQKFEKKDINQYNTVTEFMDAVSTAKQNLTKGEIKKSGKKIYESGNHLVVVPLTHAASCFYGAGTRWCTTMRGEANYFMEYTGKGTLFYYINKGNGKKRAFYTPFQEPFLAPSTISGTKNDKLGRTQIYTETDRRGRSLSGIPVAARQAMNNEHQKGFQKYLASLGEGERMKILIKNGLPLPEGYTTYVGNWEFNALVPNQITKIDGNMRSGGILNLNNITEITGNLSVDRYFNDFGNLEIVGGDLSFSSYWGTAPVHSLGKIKRIGGTFYWKSFTNIKAESLSVLESVGKILASAEQIASLNLEIKIPGLPNTKIVN